jgi:hypothetical protein
MKRNLVLFLLFFLLAACSAAQSSTPTAQVYPTKSSNLEMGDALIIYVKSGGFAGIHEEWRFSSGTLVGPDGKEHAITAKTTDALLALLSEKGFLDMVDKSREISGCADCFNYSVTAVVDGQVKKVGADDVSMNDIPGFGEIIAALEDIVSPLR